MSVVSESEVLVMFVTADGEDTATKVFRTAKNFIMCEGGKKKSKENSKLSVNHIYKTIFKGNV